MKFAPLNMTPEEIIEYTPEWTGKRFADGRPKVSDEMLERVEHVSLTQAWGVLQGAGYKWQYEDGFICTHPGGTLVGRALTAMYMPRRPDMRILMEKVGEEAGCVGDQISWPIDLLVKDDVYIADVYGKHEQGPIVGDNLSTAIYAKSGKGIVHDASVRDIDGIREIEGFASFVRGFHPTYASPTIMLLGINCPVRLGKVTVMPGDVVLGKDKGELGGGVVFIPPHLVEKVVKTSELIRLRDVFGKQRLREGVYTPGEIDRRWTDNIEVDFSAWLEDHMDELPVPPEAIREMLAERTW